LCLFVTNASASDSYSWGTVDIFDNDCSSSSLDAAECERLSFIAQQINIMQSNGLVQSDALQCLLVMAAGPRISDSPDPGNPCSANGTLGGGANDLTEADLREGLDIRGPLAVKNESGGKLDVQCTTDSPPSPCAGSGGGGTGGTVGIDTAANTVQLSNPDRERSDLMWYGLWAVVGLQLCALIIPRLYGRFRMDGSEL